MISLEHLVNSTTSSLHFVHSYMAQVLLCTIYIGQLCKLYYKSIGKKHLSLSELAEN